MGGVWTASVCNKEIHNNILSRCSNLHLNQVGLLELGASPSSTAEGDTDVASQENILRPRDKSCFIF